MKDIFNSTCELIGYANCGEISTIEAISIVVAVGVFGFLTLCLISYFISEY